MPTLAALSDVGQAVWSDFLSRDFIESGGLQSYIDRGVRGVTANPTILDKAISGSKLYDDDIRRLALLGKSDQEIYEGLVSVDIGKTADLFRPVYDQLAGADGFVSLEVSPARAYDTEGTIREVRHLVALLHRPNVMIKVPATREGIPAIRQLISEGININITLMFSLAQYEAVAEAYLSGLELYAAAGGDIRQIASVASFFVSRVDTMADKRLAAIGNEDLQGKIAIANTKIVYARFLETFTGPRWEQLAGNGARVQRPLWASTSTKNPRYPDTLYVDNLIGPDTVNTMPLETINAWLDHGKTEPRLLVGLDEAKRQLARLAELGISLDEITAQLTDDGVVSFANSYNHIISGIAEKRQRAQQGRKAA